MTDHPLTVETFARAEHEARTPKPASAILVFAAAPSASRGYSACSSRSSHCGVPT
jgi:hypothetical protein